MAKHVNLLKLCVGAETVEDLLDWQASQRHRWPEGNPRHVTRMWPKREAEILAGGSLYWVFKGSILARQPILGLESVEGSDGITRCALVLDPAVIRTVAAARRPFQGWRYLAPEDAPADLPQGRQREEPLPPDLAQALADIGLR
ncbi:DUF1489 domain-containing protein [Cereibacter sphaeroides]|uniref:DUF1489 family protein n=1 Tax=Rhodobacterales TaxID=204455 RepID=UPI000BBF30C3|nr:MULTISPECIES: DUF1489 domain-containing protein [Paracoccaceae]MCE6950709.1 DUF1489 domain-containing protein [Cereibacter sphaeroides]